MGYVGDAAGPGAGTSSLETAEPSAVVLTSVLMSDCASTVPPATTVALLSMRARLSLCATVTATEPVIWVWLSSASLLCAPSSNSALTRMPLPVSKLSGTFSM